MKHRLKQALILLLSALVAVSGFMAGRELFDRQKEKDTFDSLAELVQTAPPEQTEPPAEPENSATESIKEVEPEPSVHRRDLSVLTEKNSDCAGWLCIPDTAIDYPVMHTPKDPEKYLRMDFYGGYSVSGVPFLDSRCNPDSTNLVIYGHNMKNGTMFSSLKGYMEKGYYTAHPVIELETAAGCKSYAVFAVATVKETDDWYGFIAAPDSAAYDGQIAAIKSKALYDTGITPMFDQQILTLSTCYGSDENGRLLVIAVNTQ